MYNTSDLYEQYEGLILNEAKRFRWNGFDLNELMQMAYFGVASAAAKYDENQGIPISAFLRICVRRALVREINKSKCIKMSEHTNYKVRRYFAAKSKLRRVLQREPYDYEIADELKCPIEELKRIEKYDVRADVSLEYLYDNYSGDSLSTEEEGYNEICDNDYKIWFWKSVKKTLSAYPDHLLVIEYYFKKNMTLAEIAKEVGVSIETVRKRKETALLKLKKIAKIL